MPHYTRTSIRLQQTPLSSNGSTTEPREPLENRKRRILEALRTIQHVPVKLGKYGRYIAPVAA